MLFGVLAAVMFILLGVGLYIAVIGNTIESQVRCEAQCMPQGKVSIVAPSGTVGKSIEGGRDLTEPSYQCSCIKQNNR